MKHPTLAWEFVGDQRGWGDLLRIHEILTIGVVRCGV
jgi:hypothetical protein